MVLFMQKVCAKFQKNRWNGFQIALNTDFQKGSFLEKRV